ncbi:MAG TPA: sialidase family protein [Terrimicrobiaceae bacterium]|nr:sialidase family protein [Terrimicrobiaceae bacterium]
MNPTSILSATLALSILGSTPVRSEAGVNIVRSGIVNDSITNAQMPMGLVRVGKESLITIFNDGGDLEPGAKTYLVRSDDLGETWGEPYMVLSSDQPNLGIGGTLAELPGGKILLIEIVQTHLSGDLTMEAVFKTRTSAYNLKISSDGGKTFEPSGSLPVPAGASGGIMGTVVPLANGDLILPAYLYPGGFPKVEGSQYGSGFFRSKDGGMTWLPLEVAFADPVPGRDKPLDFNESAYVVRPDGSIVAYARIDSEIHEAGRWQSKGNHLWWVESHDNGITWSTPKETRIGGLYPAIIRMGESKYLLVCGDRHASPTRKVTFYTSNDGLNFQPAGFAPYAKTKGECLSSATGGSQALVALTDKEVYLVYYAADPAQTSRDKTHIEGCVLSLD